MRNLPAWETQTERLDRTRRKMAAGDARGNFRAASPTGRGGRGGGDVTIVEGDTGTDIHHVTLHATAGQTIAAGGAGIEWAAPAAGPPTEQRGFPSLTLPVVAIPVNIAGELEWILKGRWASYRAVGDLTVIQRRNGVDRASVTYPLGDPANGYPACRRFTESDDGWEVLPGDKIIYQLPNDSGAGQTLAEATLVQSITGVAGSTGRGTGQYRLWSAADNSSDVYVDGTLVLSTSGYTPTSVVLSLSPGVHSIGIAGTNNPLTEGGNPAMVQAVLYEYDGSADGTQILETDLTWEAQDYPGTAPDGWPESVEGGTWGSVYVQSVATNWTKHDTEEWIWSRADNTIQPAGTSYFRKEFTL